VEKGKRIGRLGISMFSNRRVPGESTIKILVYSLRWESSILQKNKIENKCSDIMEEGGGETLIGSAWKRGGKKASIPQKR